MHCRYVLFRTDKPANLQLVVPLSWQSPKWAECALHAANCMRLRFMERSMGPWCTVANIGGLERPGLVFAFELDFCFGGLAYH